MRQPQPSTRARAAAPTQQAAAADGAQPAASVPAPAAGAPPPAAAEPVQPWDQQPGEPARWFGRFQIFLQLGPTRTLQRAYQAARRLAGDPEGSPHTCANQLWCDNSRAWRWRERAVAWDVHQRDLFALGEHNARLARRDRRLALIEEQLDRVCAALEQAGIDALDPSQARAIFPQTRAFLRDLLAAERLEDDPSTLDPAAPAGAVAITADDLRAAQRQLEQTAHPRVGRVIDPTPSTAAAQRQLEQTAHPRVGRVIAPTPFTAAALFVCTAPGCALGLDLAAWRAVRAASGLPFKRVLDATPRKFSDHLHRERSFGHPVQLLHLAVPASPQGLAFAGRLADGDWLRPRLAGIRVALLPACTDHNLGDWLDVIPCVITFAPGLPAADAAILIHHFWCNLGLGQDPGAALAAALACCPATVAPHVHRHW